MEQIYGPTPKRIYTQYTTVAGLFMWDFSKVLGNVFPPWNKWGDAFPPITSLTVYLCQFSLCG